MQQHRRGEHPVKGRPKATDDDITCVPMFALTSKNRSERIDEVEWPTIRWHAVYTVGGADEDDFGSN